MAEDLRTTRNNKLDEKAMSTVESSKKIDMLLIVLAFVVSSVTLSLLESSLKPMLYFFEAALTLIMYHSLYGNFKKALFETKGMVFMNMRGLSY